MHQWWYILTLGWTSCSLSRLIILQKVKPWLNANAQRKRREVHRPVVQHITPHVWEEVKQKPVALPGEEEWTEGSAGWASPSGRRAWCGPRWSPASSVDKKRDITSLTAGNARAFFVCLYVRLFISFSREILSGGKARSLLLRIEARQNSRLRRCGRASGRERGMKTAAR